MPNFVNLLDIIYPVGSIYITTNATSPANSIGGTWEQVKDKFLIAASANYAATSSGGEATHKLTVSEMPQHNHAYRYGYYNSGAGSSDDWGRYPIWLAADKAANWSIDITAITESGGNQPHNNIPPYYAVYMWRRVL